MKGLNIVLSILFIALSWHYDNWFIMMGYCAGMLYMAILFETLKVKP